MSTTPKYLKALTIYQPTVDLVAAPALTTAYREAFRTLNDLQVSSGDALRHSDAESLYEAAGRECYDSFARPNPATARTDDYIKSIVDKMHFSVVEHGMFTFRISGISRSLSHELIRHRHCSFSQRSTRYVDESEARCVIPPRAIGTPVEDQILWAFLAARSTYSDIIATWPNEGDNRKKIREVARAVLPSCTETSMVISANARSWREFIEKRNEFADEEIFRLALAVLEALNEEIPYVVSDLYEAREEHLKS